MLIASRDAASKHCSPAWCLACAGLAAAAAASNGVDRRGTMPACSASSATRGQRHLRRWHHPACPQGCIGDSPGGSTVSGKCSFARACVLHLKHARVRQAHRACLSIKVHVCFAPCCLSLALLVPTLLAHCISLSACHCISLSCSRRLQRTSSASTLLWLCAVPRRRQQQQGLQGNVLKLLRLPLYPWCSPSSNHGSTASSL